MALKLLRNIGINGKLFGKLSEININNKVNYMKSNRFYARMLSDPENKGERQDHVNFDTLGTWYAFNTFHLII
jgi:hypothetical protein